LRAGAPQLLALAGLLGAVSCLAGCGLGTGAAPSAVHLLVTRDFGARVLHEAPRPKVAGQETVMRLLERNDAVSTRYGGGFVQSIDGSAAGHEAGQPTDWFYYVNGVQATTGAAATDVRAGDHIWWDLHDWSQTESVPAVVGSFPEPFLNGLTGKRLPVRVECAEGATSACTAVTGRLQAAGVPAATSAIGPGEGSETLRVLVGPWGAIDHDPTAAQIERGPRTSGVYVTFGDRGTRLSLLDQAGMVVRTLTGAAGLIAATRQGEDAPVWVVTGTDEKGAALAAAAFGEATLRDRFAVAVTAGAVLPIPAEGR
jgi:hypothetical protein